MRGWRLVRWVALAATVALDVYGWLRLGVIAGALGVWAVLAIVILDRMTRVP